jgi:hypothetical protein
LRRSLALAALGILGALVFATTVLASGPTTLGRTIWQMSRPYGPVLTSPSPVHGDARFYNYIPSPGIPGASDASWADCGPGNYWCPSADTIGMYHPNESRLGPLGYPCLASVDYTFFQSFVSIPAGTTVSEFKVVMNGADDGARVSIYNSLYPDGFIFPGSYIFLSGGTGSTTDLSPYVVAGEVNRVLITQIDDCAVGNNLQFAQILLNGTVVPPAPADTTPPVDAPVISPAANGAGWHNTNVDVAWNWTDADSDIDAANCTQSSSSTGEGTITLTSSCRDVVGNAASDSVTVKVDKTAPTVTYTGNAGTYSLADTVSISCDSSDALSGVASDTCADLSAPAWTLGVGTHTLSATAVDRSGNTGSGSATFTVTADAGGLCALIRSWAKNAGLANSLCVKLNAAAAATARGQAATASNIMGAFRNEVAAQFDKGFTAAQAQLLLDFAAGL